MNEIEIKELAQQALETGDWILRRSDDGKAYNGFQWEPVGEWTEAPDWNPESRCGGGLHGSAPEAWGYFTDGPTLDFCVTEGERIIIGNNKIKIPRAMILLRNELPDNLSVGGSLNLRGTQITSLPDDLKVDGRIYR